MIDSGKDMAEPRRLSGGNIRHPPKYVVPPTLARSRGVFGGVPETSVAENFHAWPGIQSVETTDEDMEYLCDSCTTTMSTIHGSPRPKFRAFG